jgi:cytochrome bd ubiquinol oxidase subunit II
MELSTVWFGLITVLWIGYFVLEGFDFGVGILLPVIGKDELRRRVLINTIGPVWDGNEVWLLTAGGAMFAAFPLWYASLFSGFYLALLLILAALIIRGVAFEYRAKRDSVQWRANWDRAIFIGSVVPALLWGVAFGNIIRGTPIDAQGNFVGNFFDLLNPYALVGGLMTLTLIITHGAVFLALKTSGEVREAARGIVFKVGPVAAAIAVVFLLWSQVYSNNAIASLVLALLAAVAFLGGLYATFRNRDGWAFVLTSATMLLGVTCLFVGLYPDVMRSSLDSAFTLTTTNASSSVYTLKVMTVVALIMTPIVLIYQGWTYWIFRQRISTSMIPDEPAPGRSDDRFAGTVS